MKRTHRTNSEPVVAVVVVHVAIARIEIEVPRVVRVIRVERTRPVVTVRASIVETAFVAVAGGRQEETYSIASAVILFSGLKECLFASQPPHR